MFNVPRESVKGRKRDRILVCNSVAQSIIESVRGQHPEFVFVYSQRLKDPQYARIETMNNTAWQEARKKAPGYPTFTFTICGTRLGCGCGRPTFAKKDRRHSLAHPPGDDGALLHESEPRDDCTRSFAGKKSPKSPMQAKSG